jgi:hypothetical protein
MIMKKEKTVCCISKKLVWLIPIMGCCFLTGMYIPTDSDESGSDKGRNVVSTEKLIARWSFDSPNPGRNGVSDNFHARIGRKVGIVAGVTGNAVDISSKEAKDASIEVSHEVLPEDLNELTFSAWIAPRTFGRNATIIRKEDIGVHGENQLLFAIQNQGKFLTLGINCGGNYAECDALVAPQELCDGNWHLVVGTFDARRIMHVYLDGREIGAFERQAPLNTVYDFTPIKAWRDDIANSNYTTLEDVTVRGVPVFIGSSGGKDDLFNGKIDDVRFYADALDQQAVAKLYAEGKQSLSAGVKQAQETANKLYSKGNSFLETLVAIDKKFL